MTTEQGNKYYSGVHYHQERPPLNPLASSLGAARRLFPQDIDLQEALQRTEYIRACSLLRQYPPDTQRVYLELVLGVEGIDCPHSLELSELMARVNNISYFQPKQEPEITHLQRLLDRYQQAINQPTLPVMVVRDDWLASLKFSPESKRTSTTKDLLFQMGQAAAEQHGRNSMASYVSFIMTWSIAMSATGISSINDWDKPRENEVEAAIFKAKKQAILVATYAAVWILIQESMSQKGCQNNPFEPLVELYELGCQPRGVVRDGRRKKIAIFIPPLVKPATVPPLEGY